VNGKPKDPAAVSLGRRGGRIGGKARVKTKGFGSLTAEQRIESARKAANKRWEDKRKGESK
jgi:hypothetical protein